MARLGLTSGMVRMLFVLGCGAVALLGLSHSAQAELCHQSVAVRINSSGLDFVAQKVEALLPTEVAVPALDAVVVDWPMTADDARVQTDPMAAAINLRDFRLYFAGPNLHIAMHADISAGGPVKVLNPYASFGSADCQANLQLNNLHIDIGAQVTTGGRVQVTVNDALITFDESSIIALEGCTLGNILTKVVGFIRNHFMTQVEGKLQDIAKAKIPQLVQAKLSEAIGFEGEIKGFTYAAELEAIDSDPYGVEVILGAELGLPVPTTPPPCLAGVAPERLAPPASCTGIMPRLDKQQPAMFGAGVSETLVNNILHSAWRSGMLCMTSEELLHNKPALAGALNALTSGLGMPDARLGFAFQVKQPPYLRLSESAASLELNEAHLQISLVPKSGAPGELTIETNLVVQVNPTIAPRAGTVGIDLRRIAVRKLKVVGKGGVAGLPLDAARVERFLEVVLVPALQQKVAGMALSPAVIGFDAYLVDLKAIRIRDGFLGAYADVYEPQETDDRISPETALVEGPGGLVGPQMVTVYVAGQDNETPASLMRYSYRVDGGAWSEPSFGRRIDTASTSGVHRVEVVAVDLQGNSDESPLFLEFEVDADPPAVQIVRRPPQLVDGDVAQVTFHGIDGRTPAAGLSFQVQLFRVPDGGGVPEVIETRPYLVNVDRARFEGLENGVYRIRVTARDEAGNVSSEDAGFAVEQGGCSLGGRPTGTGLGLLLLLAVALARRVRLGSRR